ncbi:MAG: hypothetical protein OEX01_00485 [Candidatus Bathyarchaeota archaeon]|nr:hypothetical protein [Candidatus Bathyarchaeota archaeon]
MSFRHILSFIDFLKKIHPKYMALLFILMIASILVSVMTMSRYLWGSPFEEYTQVNGIQTYFTSTNDEGNISITQDSVRLEAKNNSFPKAFVYAAANDFIWNFSAIPLLSSGFSYPIYFSVEWIHGSISVWAETESGWYYNFISGGNFVQNNASIGGGPINIGSKYNVEIEWNEQIEHILVTFSIENETGAKEFHVNIPEVGLSPALSLQAWANYDAHVAVYYVQSSFLTYNSRYSEESYVATVASIFGSIIFTILTVLVFVSQSDRFYPLLNSSLKLGVQRLNGTIRRIYSFFIIYVKENKSFVYLLAFFAVLRIILAISLPAHWFDMYAFRAWCQVINEKGLLSIYPETAVLPPIHFIRPVYPYPPVIAYFFFLITQVLPTNIPNSEVLPALLKVPPILAELALAWVTFTVVKRWKGHKFGLAAATLTMLNVVNSSVWGQYESVIALFMVLAVWFVVTKHVELGWMSAALAVATKSTALPFVPAVLLVSIKKWGFFRTLVGIGIFSLTTIIVWAPFLLSGYSLNFVLWQFGFGLFSSRGAFTPASSEITKTTVFALNIWPLINLVIDRVPPGISALATVSDNKPNQFLFLSYYQLGILLFAVLYILILYSLLKDTNSQGIMGKFGLLLFVFYMIPTRMHERYMYLALSFLPLAYGSAAYIKKFSILLLVTFSINLFSALSEQWTPSNVLNIFGSFSFVGNVGILCLTLINISVLITWLYQLIKEIK